MDDFFIVGNATEKYSFAVLPLISPLQELVDDLYKFRDCYFETHSMEDAEKKDSDVTQEIEKTLKYLQEKESEWTICTFPFLAGQIQMCLSNFPQISLSKKQSSCCRRAGV